MIRLPAKLNLACTPTPIQRMPRLSEAWGVELRVKRDDLTGTELSGNKIRKLEYLLSDAYRRECDTVVTCGAVTSNHARATALAARRLGMDTHLLLAGFQPEVADGNLLLELLAGAHIQYVSWKDYSSNIQYLLERTAHQLTEQGKRPYVIPTGGSNPVGMMGYVEAIREIMKQCYELTWKPDILVCAVGSGGTYAGLLFGNSVGNLADQVSGVIVCNSVPYFTKKVLNDVQGTAELLNAPNLVKQEQIHFIDGYMAGGYAKTCSEHLRFFRHIAQEESLILDPVYSGKAFFGLYHEILKGSIPRGSRVLFIHTGGIFGLSAFIDAYTQEWGSVEHWPV